MKTQKEKTETKDTNKKELVTPECGCFPDYHVYNSNEIRIRGFVKWLSALPKECQPDVLCFQELMWLPTTEYLSSRLEQLGYTTGINIDPLSPDNQGTYTGMGSATFKRAGSGLAMYYKDAVLNLKQSGKAMFEHRLGADYLCEKGYLWCVFERNHQHFAVMTLHPQAYVDIALKGPPCENKLVSEMRGIAVMQMKSLGGYPMCIEQIHVKQFEQIRNTIQKLKEITPNIIITGDFNVNSFKAEVNSKEEQSYETAVQGEDEGREFRNVQKILEAKSVASASQVGSQKPYRLTWDPDHNLFCRSHDTNIPSVYQKIDHTFITNDSQFSYVDQQIVPLRLNPFPELDLFWTSACFKMRAVHGSNPSNTMIHQSLMKGIEQRNKALQQASLEQKNDPKQWIRYIQQLPFSQSSQLWKGLEWYGFLTQATPTEPIDFGIQQFQSEYAKQLLNEYKIGDPHPFRMLAEVSDHAGLMTRFVL